MRTWTGERNFSPRTKFEPPLPRPQRLSFGFSLYAFILYDDTPYFEWFGDLHGEERRDVCDGGMV
jgi:hypothetical protein